MEETRRKQVSKEIRQQALVEFQISDGSKGRSENWVIYSIIYFGNIQQVEPLRVC